MWRWLTLLPDDLDILPKSCHERSGRPYCCEDPIIFLRVMTMIQILLLTMMAFLWILARCGVALWFFTSDYQAYGLLFAMAAVWPDIYVCKYLAKWHERAQGAGEARDGRFPKAVFLLGLGLSVLASPFCAAVVSIHSESATGSSGTFHGVVSINEAIALPDDSCFTVPEAAAFVWYLGAVEYNITQRVEKFYYAAPLESVDWEPNREVRIWAIVDERELSNGDLTQHKVACQIPSRNMHYEAFRKAVANAEERFDLKSANNAILVRLVDESPASSLGLSGAVFWILVLYSLAAVPVLLYPVGLMLVPNKQEDTVRSEEVGGSAPATDSASPIALDTTKNRWASKRRFWFGLHAIGFIPCSVFMIYGLTDLVSLSLVVIIPAIELWLLMRAFPQPETRGSVRMALTWLMPVTMLFALILVNVGKFSVEQAASYNPQTDELLNQTRDPLDLENKFATILRHGAIVRIPEEYRPRAEWLGRYWAPNSETKTWRVVPMLSKSWDLGQPVKFWLESTDRLDSQSHDEPPKFVRVTMSTSFQFRQAIADAEYHHNLTAADQIVMLEPVVDPQLQAKEALGLIVLGFLGCCLSWAVCAAFWPRWQH